MKADITIATHAGLAAGSPDDVALADALRQRGASCRFAVWDDTAVDWHHAPTTVVRSTWDYHRAPMRWLDWIDRLNGKSRLVNDAELLRWNTEKSYLRTLGQSGVAIVPTLFVEPQGCTNELEQKLRDTGWTDLVVKPAIAASAFGARRFRCGELTPALEHAKDLLRTGSILIQPFQDVVLTAHERSLVMLGGQFSHAFTKGAFDPGAASGPQAPTSYTPNAPELALADQALATLPVRPVYARVDLVPAENGPLLMELELIEPYLALNKHAAGLFAKHLLANTI